jgi:hypothetical protein
MQDTYNLLGTSIRKLVRAIAKEQGEPARAVARRYGFEDPSLCRRTYSTYSAQTFRGRTTGAQNGQGRGLRRPLRLLLTRSSHTGAVPAVTRCLFAGRGGL